MKGVVQSTFAKYEDIDDVIRPLLIQNGFSLRFNSRESNGKVVITGTLAHRDGHSITDEIPLAIDASGSKNNVQGRLDHLIRETLHRRDAPEPRFRGRG